MKVVFDTRWLDSLIMFSAEMQLDVIRGVFSYLEGVEQPKMEQAASFVFETLRPFIKEERDKRMRMAERNRANGSKGGRKPKEKENPKEPKKPSGFSSYLEQEKYKQRCEKLQKLDKWMETYTPYLYNHIPPLIQKEFDVLCKKYTGEQICDTLLQIENRKDLRKRYVSLYRTLLNWLKTNYGNS